MDTPRILVVDDEKTITDLVGCLLYTSDPR